MKNISSSLASTSGLMPTDTSSLPIYGSAMHPNSSQSDSLIRECGLDINGIPRNDLAGQLAYMTGRAARAMVLKAWDSLCRASDQAASVIEGAASVLTLPGASAASTPSEQIDKAEILKKLEFSLDAKFQKSTDKDVQKRLDKIRTNIIAEFEKAAELGLKTTDHLQKCMDGVARIEILDPTYSKTKLKNSMNYLGLYDPNTNVLRLISHFEGKHMISTILHECEHVRQFIEGKPVPDLRVISECQKKLKTLLIRTVECFDNSEKRGCKKISGLAHSYSNMPLVITNKLEPGRRTKLTLSETNLKASKNGMAIDFEQSKEKHFSVMRPEGVIDISTDVYKEATPEDIGMINMMWGLDQNQGKTEEHINRGYAHLSKEQILAEQFANRITEIPEKILEDRCPEVLDQKKVTAKDEL